MARTKREVVQERVYDIEIDTKATFRTRGPISSSTVEKADSHVRVDDIAHGEVALVGASDDPDAAFHTTLGPDQCRELARALTNAAEYAEDQRERDS